MNPMNPIQARPTDQMMRRHDRPVNTNLAGCSGTGVMTASGRAPAQSLAPSPRSAAQLQNV
jgi:hypothetical protein